MASGASKNQENTSDKNVANQSTAESNISTLTQQTAVSGKSTEISAVCSEVAQEQPPEQLLEEETDDINEQTAISDNNNKQNDPSQSNINGEPLVKVARFTNIETDLQDKEAISDIVENLARLENNEELNIIQETITEDSRADQQTQVSKF